MSDYHTHCIALWKDYTEGKISGDEYRNIIGKMKAEAAGVEYEPKVEPKQDWRDK